MTEKLRSQRVKQCITNIIQIQSEIVSKFSNAEIFKQQLRTYCDARG